MTAMTESRLAPEKEGNLVLMPVKSGAAIFQNAILIVEATAVGVLPAVASAGARLAGIAYESNEDGATVVRVKRDGAHPFFGTGFAAADLLKPVYASDDQTVSTTQATNEVEVGTIIQILSATEVLVALKK